MYMYIYVHQRSRHGLGMWALALAPIGSGTCSNSSVLRFVSLALSHTRSLSLSLYLSCVLSLTLSLSVSLSLSLCLSFSRTCAFSPSFSFSRSIFLSLSLSLSLPFYLILSCALSLWHYLARSLSLSLSLMRAGSLSLSLSTLPTFCQHISFLFLDCCVVCLCVCKKNLCENLPTDCFLPSPIFTIHSDSNGTVFAATFPVAVSLSQCVSLYPSLPSLTLILSLSLLPSSLPPQPASHTTPSNRATS